MTGFFVIVAMLGAGAIWLIASTRESDAASLKLRRKQAEKRARFARAEIDAEVVQKPKPKSPSFGHR